MSAVIDALAAIRDQHGDLTPELVADVAAEQSHPLHSHIYDKPVAEAARAYYVSRAAQLLRVTFRPDPAKPADLRAFVAVRGEDAPRSSYVPVAEVAADEFASKLLLQQMRREWQAFKRRYEHMSEFVALVQAEAKEAAS